MTIAKRPRLAKPMEDDEAQPTSPQVVTKVAATRLKAADVNSKAFRELLKSSGRLQSKASD